MFLHGNILLHCMGSRCRVFCWKYLVSRIFVDARSSGMFIVACNITQAYRHLSALSSHSTSFVLLSSMLGASSTFGGVGCGLSDVRSVMSNVFGFLFVKKTMPCSCRWFKVVSLLSTGSIDGNFHVQGWGQPPNLQVCAKVLLEVEKTSKYLLLCTGNAHRLTLTENNVPQQCLSRVFEVIVSL